MKLRAGASSLPKNGNRDDENQDAYFPKHFESVSVPFSCAISDGAAETLFSGLWANLVAELFGTAKNYLEFTERLPNLRETWKERTKSKALKWYTEQKLEKGAFATLLGVRITRTRARTARKSRKWSAVAAGDSCLFHVRGGNVVAVFPPFKSVDFNAHPICLSTLSPLPADNANSVFRFASGTLECGDRLYLATDALSAWIVRGLESNSHPFDRLEKIIKEGRPLVEVVEDLRATGELKNDDCTLLWVECVRN